MFTFTVPDWFLGLHLILFPFVFALAFALFSPKLVAIVAAIFFMLIEPTNGHINFFQYPPLIFEVLFFTGFVYGVYKLAVIFLIE